MLIEEHGCKCCTQIYLSLKKLGVRIEDDLFIVNMDSSEYRHEDYGK